MPEVKPLDIPSVTDAESYGKITEGGQYTTPEGKLQVKPYVVNKEDPSSYRDIPDGRLYRDPEGVLRTKPTYEPIHPGAQTLFDMTDNVEEQEKVLSKFYGADSIKRDPVGDPYIVTQDGKRLKPGRGMPAVTGAIASQALPMGLAAGGDFLGGAGGGPVGAVAGGAAGSMLGQELNNTILRAAGVYDETGAQEFKQLMGAAQGGGIGSGVGRGAGLIAGGAAKAAGVAGSVIPSWLRGVMGADPERLKIALDLDAQGVRSWPSKWATHTPVLPFYEAMSRRFGFDPVRTTGKEYYERTATDLLHQLGVERGSAGRLTEQGSIPGVRAASAVDPGQAGQLLRDRVNRDMAVADGRLEVAQRAAEAAARERAAGTSADADRTYQDALKALNEEANSATMQAQHLLDGEFKSIIDDNKKAIDIAKAGENPGDLARNMANKIVTLRTAITRRARMMYSAADKAAGDDIPDVSKLTGAVDEFRSRLPQDIKENHPGLVIMLDKLGKPKEAQGGVGGQVAADFGAGGAGGEPAKSEPMTFGQLRMLRTMLRDVPNWGNLDPSFRDGMYKFFSGKVDEAIHDSANSPGIQRAAGLLDQADSFYSKNMAQFRDTKIQQITDTIKAGMPPDPGEIASMAMQGGWTERMGALRRITGPQVWKAVQSADTNQMIQASRRVDGTISGKDFARQVEDRVQNGVLDGAYDKVTADRLKLQASRALFHGGDSDIVLAPGDTLETLSKRLFDAREQIKQMAQQNPERVLRDEMQRAQRESAMRARTLTVERRNDPLSFLASPSVGAVDAAEKILGSPDLMKTVMQRYGQDSPEWITIRNVAVRRILQREFDSTGKLLGDVAGKIPEEAQRMLFPGQAYDDFHKLASNMEYLISDVPDMGSSLATAAGVMNPASWLNRLSHPIGKVAKAVPTVAARAAVEGVVAAFARFGTGGPLLRYVAKGLDGSPAQREAIREFVRKAIASGGAGFSAAGAGGANTPPGFVPGDTATYGGTGTPVQP